MPHTIYCLGYQDVVLTSYSPRHSDCTLHTPKPVTEFTIEVPLGSSAADIRRISMQEWRRRRGGLKVLCGRLAHWFQ